MESIFSVNELVCLLSYRHAINVQILAVKRPLIVLGLAEKIFIDIEWRYLMLQTNPMLPESMPVPPIFSTSDRVLENELTVEIPPMNLVHNVENSMSQQREDHADYLEAKAAYTSYLASGEEAVPWEAVKQELQL